MGARFLEVHSFHDFVWMVCVLVNVHCVNMSDFKLESLILAQNERWRQA